VFKPLHHPGHEIDKGYPNPNPDKSHTTQLSEAFVIESCIKLERHLEGANGERLWSIFGIAEVTVAIVAFLGGSHWDSTGQPLLSVDPNCVFTEQLPGSDIQTGCLSADGGRAKQWHQPWPSAAHR